MTTHEQLTSVSHRVTKVEHKINIIGKNTLYIKEIVDKIAEKNDLIIENLNVEEMNFDTEDLEDSNLEGE